ncbi:MAG: hypothetical protein GC192_13550 [Bacteroidetes bacterium]|nr:hypothetical protein [Bacteroidota bacterium]
MEKPHSLLSQLVQAYDQLKYALLEAQTFHPGHYGFPPIYYDIMEADPLRIGAFKRAFEQYDFEGKTVCEAGVGRLALSRHYLPKVKKAYLFESNPALFDFIKNEIAKNGWAHKVELIFEDAMQVELPEPVDFIIGEMMSIYCANEYQVQVFRHLRKHLKADGRLLPQKIINLAQLAHASFEEGHQHYPIFFAHHLPELLSTQQVVNTLDFYTVEATVVKTSIPILPLLSGEVNAVFLQSYVQVAEGCNFTGTDSLMPPTVCQLAERCQVTAGEEVLLHCEFEYGTSLDEARFWVEKKQ